jgi:hypothetical protein
MIKLLAAIILLPTSLFAQMVSTGNHRKIFPSGPVVQPCGGVECTDNFPGTSLSANWTTTLGSFTVSSGNVGSSSGGQALTYYNVGTWTANQYSCVTLSTAATGDFVGPGARIAASGNTAYFAELAAGTQTNIQLVNAGSYSVLTGNVAVTIGHEYCLKAVGSTLTLTDNGTTVLTATDSTLTTGYAGLSSYSSASGTTVKLWRGGNL